MVRGKTAAKTDKAAEPTAAQRVRLQEPVQVGTLTVQEAEAIKERKRIRELYEVEYKDAQEKLGELAKLIQLLANESSQFLLQIVKDRGFDIADAYDVRSDTGIIWRVTGPAPAPSIEDAAPIEPSTVTEANGTREAVEA